MKKEELIEQLREAQAHSVIDADAVSMMEGVLQVADLAVRDLMIPRGQMDVLDINEPLDTLLPLVIEAARVAISLEMQPSFDDVFESLTSRVPKDAEQDV